MTTDQDFDPADVRFPDDVFEHFMVASEAAKRGLTWRGYALATGQRAVLDERTWNLLMEKNHGN